MEEMQNYVQFIGAILPRRHKSLNEDTDVRAAAAPASLYGTTVTTQLVFAKGDK